MAALPHQTAAPKHIAREAVHRGVVARSKSIYVSSRNNSSSWGKSGRLVIIERFSNAIQVTWCTAQCFNVSSSLFIRFFSLSSNISFSYFCNSVRAFSLSLTICRSHSRCFFLSPYGSYTLLQNHNCTNESLFSFFITTGLDELSNLTLSQL